MEIWKDIEGYEGLYQVSNYGNVLSLNYANKGYPKQLTPKCNNRGRLWVELVKQKKKKPMLMHRLVAMAFIPNPNNYPQINHKDENPKNNEVSNLEWCDSLYNNHYSMELHPERPRERKSTPQYGKRCSLKVNQYDTAGKLIKQWKNSRAIYLETKMSDWSISECCRGNRRSAYGFIWRYAD